MAGILGRKRKRNTACAGFNATLLDAPHGSALLTAIVFHPGRRFGFMNGSSAGLLKAGHMDTWDLFCGKQDRAADAGRSLQ
jgi:hypothetical protein